MGKTLQYSTVVCSVFTVLGMLHGFAGAGKDNYSGHYYIYLFEVFGMFSLACLSLLNFACIFTRVQPRVSSVVGCTIALFAVFTMFLLDFKTDERRDKWFLTRGICEYQRQVEFIKTQKDKLSNHVMFFGEGPYGRHTILASTNSDGSLFLTFDGRGVDPRQGYLYYDGPQAIGVVGEPGLYRLGDSLQTYRRITNNWYLSRY